MRPNSTITTRNKTFITCIISTSSSLVDNILITRRLIPITSQLGVDFRTTKAHNCTTCWTQNCRKIMCCQHEFVNLAAKYVGGCNALTNLFSNLSQTSHPLLKVWEDNRAVFLIFRNGPDFHGDLSDHSQHT